MVPFGLRIAWRRASWPTSRSPLSVKATTDGVVREPSALGITVGSPPSSAAITELVVPRSMPTALAIPASLCMAGGPVRRTASAPPTRASSPPAALRGGLDGSICDRSERSAEAHWSRWSGLPVPIRVGRLSEWVGKLDSYHHRARLNRNPPKAAVGKVSSSRLGAVAAGQDHLRHRVGAETELGGDLVRAHPLLVVDQRELLLRLGPPGGGAGGARPPGSGPVQAAAGAGPLATAALAALAPATVAAALAAVALPPPRRRPLPGQVGATGGLLDVGAGGHLVPDPLVQDPVLVRGLVHPKGDDRQALGILLLALRVGAVIVLFRAFGV